MTTNKLNIDLLREALEQLIDPTLNKTIKETEGIKHLGYDDDNDIITLIVGIGQLGGDNETAFRRSIARVVKIDFGVKGLRLQVEESKKYNSITRKNIKFIGIASGKGGVGKSLIACNIAYRLAKRGIKVGIIDCDIYTSSIPTLLNIPHQKPVYNDEKKILPPSINDIEVMSIDFFVEPNQPIAWRGGMLNSLLNVFFYDTLWNPDTEYIIIDYPSGTGDIMLDIKAIVPQADILLVTTPDELSVHNVSKQATALANIGHDILGVIENMSYYTNPLSHSKEYLIGEGGGKDLALNLNTEFIASLEIRRPNNHQVLYEIEEQNGKTFDFIVDYLIFKTSNK